MKTIPHAPARTMLAVTMLTFMGCSQQQDVPEGTASSSRLVVVSANYPLHYFAQRIGGDLIAPSFLVPPDVDPAYWEPTSGDIATMQQSHLVLLNGAGYEKWLTTVSLPEHGLVDTSAGVSAQLISEKIGSTHQHGPGGEHTHDETAFTTWLDLSVAIQQALAVERALARQLPDHALQFAENLTSLTNDLAAIDRDLMAWGTSIAGQPVIASHPVYQYLARRYGVDLESVHWEPNQILGVAEEDELDAMLKQHPAKLMIWEAQPTPSAVDKLRHRGMTCKVFEPCGSPPETGDFLSIMRENVQRLRR